MKHRLCLFVVFVMSGLALAGCGSGDEGRADQEAPTTVIERTVVEQTVYKTVMEETEKADESTTVEVRDDSPSPVGENNLSNDTGAISAEVPDEWSDRRTDEIWELNGVAIGAAFTATTDLYGWEESGQATAGTYITASASLAESATDDEILDQPTTDLSEICTVLQREDFESHGYTGRIQGGTDCQPSGKSLFNVVASKEGRECVVTVQIGYTTDEEKEQAQTILDTFEADCEKVAEFEKGLEDYVVEEPAPEPTPPAISCGGFASQYAAQQYYDFNATPEEQAIFDPDANGFACDVELLGYQLEYEEPETQSSDPSAPGYVEPPTERDGVCEGIGEIDPDCADAMEDSLRETNPEMFD